MSQWIEQRLKWCEWARDEGDDGQIASALRSSLDIARAAVKLLRETVKRRGPIHDMKHEAEVDAFLDHGELPEQRERESEKQE